jgi:hypothetical protein
MRLSSQVKPHAFVIRSPQLRVLALFAPAGLEEAFRGMSSPAQRLELPTETPTYSTGDLKQIAKRLDQYGVRILTPDEVVEQMPLYPKPISSTSESHSKQRGAQHEQTFSKHSDDRRCS